MRKQFNLIKENQVVKIGDSFYNGCAFLFLNTDENLWKRKQKKKNPMKKAILQVTNQLTKRCYHSFKKFTFMSTQMRDHFSHEGHRVAYLFIWLSYNIKVQKE